MKYYIQFSKDGAYLHGEAPHQRRCDLATSDGRVYRHTVGFVIAQHSTEAADEAGAITTLGLVAYVEPLKPLKGITKFVLTEKLIALGKAVPYAAILDSLTLEEKLVWNSTNNIEPTNPLLVGKKEQLLSVLGMTSLEFDNLFR